VVDGCSEHVVVSELLVPTPLESEMMSLVSPALLSVDIGDGPAGQHRRERAHCATTIISRQCFVFEDQVIFPSKSQCFLFLLFRWKKFK
jgi:hypothetical protein